MYYLLPFSNLNGNIPNKLGYIFSFKFITKSVEDTNMRNREDQLLRLFLAASI